MQKSIGSTSASAYETILANGFKFSYFTIFSEDKIKAIPASFILDALPAVIVPVLEKTALSYGIFSFF
jgi:hypothetical protein